MVLEGRRGVGFRCAEVARTAPELVRDGDVVPFVYTNMMPYWFKRQKLGDRWLIYANQGFYRATAYYVTLVAAWRLLQASMPLWFIDFGTGYLATKA